MTAHNQHTNADQTESLLQQVQALESEVRGVMKAQLRLAGLETRRAGESFVRMVAFGIIAACLAFSAWALFIAAAVVAVVTSGLLSLTATLTIVSVGHVAATFYIVSYIKRRSRNLLFSKTSNSL